MNKKLILIVFIFLLGFYVLKQMPAKTSSEASVPMPVQNQPSSDETMKKPVIETIEKFQEGIQKSPKVEIKKEDLKPVYDAQTEGPILIQ